MQLLTLTATLLALTPIATADFSLYKVGRGGTGLVGNVEGWQVYANTPDTIRCKSVRESLDWGLRPDVSGKKTGVRCKTEKGTCTRSRGGGEILEMELNERPIDGGANYHFSKPNCDILDSGGGRCRKELCYHCAVSLTLHRLPGSLLQGPRRRARRSQR